MPAMNQLYASAVGTSVLQAQEIPPRPSDFDGVVCLFGVGKEVSEAAVRSALGRFGETIVDIIDRRLPPVERDGEIAVRFVTHEDALAAIAAGPEIGLCTGMGTMWNDRPYNERGWQVARDRTPLSNVNTAARTADDDGRHPRSSQVLL